MYADRCTGKYLLAVLSGVVLSACSPNASTAVPPAQASPPVVAAVTTAPLVTGLPDFTALVDQYGSAVVNVQVTERPAQQVAQQRGQDGSGNDPFQEFFRRFGIPNPNGGGGPGIPRGVPQQPSRGEGSGFIVTADGYILTNAHVVKGASEVVVKMTDRREYPAKVIGFDERSDVAVIKIEGKNLPVVRIGDPNKLKPGQWVVAIGSPFGMENSVTAGIVSATSRRLPNESYVPFIQTDVAVNPGNSGGPLFNLNGEVVGINSQIYSQSGGYMGLSFAIPIDMANDVREQLVSTGRVSRSMIGVNIKPVDAGFAESFGLDRPRGALVERVTNGGPAEKAGIKAGDIILSVNGKPVESELTLPTMISVIKPGTATEIEVWSDRKLRKVTARVTELQEEGAAVPTKMQGGSKPETAAPVALGMTVRPLTADEKQQLETAGTLVVEEVTGPAESAGIQPGDIILGVNGASVKTTADLQAAAKRSGKVVALHIQREDRTTFIAVRPE
ncbi:MAG: DegQ family serine endoprotease [Steroidobacteraceae bacterium]